MTQTLCDFCGDVIILPKLVVLGEGKFGNPKKDACEECFRILCDFAGEKNLRTANDKLQERTTASPEAKT